MIVPALIGFGIDPAAVRAAAWVARCVGRGAAAPLRGEDVAALAGYLQHRRFEPGSVLFPAGRPSAGVWIVRAGSVELAVGSGRRRVVVGFLRPGDVDGDIQLLEQMHFPYTGRAGEGCECLHLPQAAFEELLAERPAITRRWLSSVATRLTRSQARLLSLLGRSLPAQIAQLLLDEAGDTATIALSQQTVAAMLGVRRPSVNKILKDLERDGQIGLHYREIQVLDPVRLARTAAS